MKQPHGYFFSFCKSARRSFRQDPELQLHISSVRRTQSSLGWIDGRDKSGQLDLTKGDLATHMPRSPILGMAFPRCLSCPLNGLPWDYGLFWGGGAGKLSEGINTPLPTPPSMGTSWGRLSELLEKIQNLRNSLTSVIGPCKEITGGYLKVLFFFLNARSGHSLINRAANVEWVTLQ